jgi:very-short-patch-repair endonuclease
MPDAPAFEHACRVECQWGGADARIAALAERRHGVVTRGQLEALGLGRGATAHRVGLKRLHPVHRGVYAVGHRVLSREGRFTAAALAAGPGAVVSHRSAAVLWGIRGSPGAHIEVTVPRSLRSCGGVTRHHARLAADETTIRDGIPVTTVPRTLLDLAAVLGRREVERAANEAEIRRLTDPLSLDDLVNRYPGRAGSATIKALLAAGRMGADVTRSELEDAFLVFLEQFGLPRPQVNRPVQVRGYSFVADCLWSPQRVIAELDGHATHATRDSFERDRARDRILQATGWRVVRITWRQLHTEARALARDLSRLL